MFLLASDIELDVIGCGLCHKWVSEWVSEIGRTLHPTRKRQVGN